MTEFALPWLLLLAPLPLLSWLIHAKSEDKDVATIITPFYQQWHQLQQQTQLDRTNWWQRLLTLVVWILLCVAAARPQWIKEPIELPVSGRDLLLSLDISGSMEEQDLTLNGQPANRLQVVKSIVSEFIKKRKGDRLGLVLFGEKAYLQTPLTFDLKTVQYMLDETDIGLAGASRTAIGDGIGLSVKQLQKRPQQNRILIILTDGRNNAGELEPLEAAKLAKHAGVKIYTIGVGADEMLRRSLLFGTTKINPSAELDEKTLKQVAVQTGGQYFRARNTKELASIYEQLDKLEPVEDKPNVYRPVVELYYWPLLVAFALLWSTTLVSWLKFVLSQRKDSGNYQQASYSEKH